MEVVNALGRRKSAIARIFVSNTGIPKRLASRTAIFSFITSITNKADGRRVRSAIEPNVLSNLAR